MYFSWLALTIVTPPQSYWFFKSNFFLWVCVRVLAHFGNKVTIYLWQNYKNVYICVCKQCVWWTNITYFLKKASNLPLSLKENRFLALMKCSLPPDVFKKIALIKKRTICTSFVSYFNEMQLLNVKSKKCNCQIFYFL